MVGKTALDNPDLPIDFVRDLLVAGAEGPTVLMAYEYDPATRMLLLLGSHENFYRKRKRSVSSTASTRFAEWGTKRPRLHQTNTYSVEVSECIVQPAEILSSLSPSAKE